MGKKKGGRRNDSISGKGSGALFTTFLVHTKKEEYLKKIGGTMVTETRKTRGVSTGRHESRPAPLKSVVAFEQMTEGEGGGGLRKTPGKKHLLNQ